MSVREVEAVCVQLYVAVSSAAKLLQRADGTGPSRASWRANSEAVVFQLDVTWVQSIRRLCTVVLTHPRAA